jgi:[ribosomal protein S18]-alanine N-acetyltransferase
VITIRPAIPADQPEIEAILAASPEAANWADTYPILVADVDNQISAFLLYRPIGDECEILNLAVHPNHRRQGLAKHLIRRLIFLDPHITQWHLEVRESNTAAIGLYQQLGFSIQGRRPKYYSNGETALLLSRRHTS